MEKKIIHAPIDEIVEAVMGSYPFDYGERDCDCEYFLDKNKLRTVLERFVVCQDCNSSGQVAVGEEGGFIIYSNCPSCTTPKKGGEDE